jgi:glycerol-3-phosphate O-acyltransferase / dihydroxyacetone phosphate acyltransferase
MFYDSMRALVRFALRLFYRITVAAPEGPLDGPVLFVGNHPNSIIDPALIFATTPRTVTFLAKEPLFRVPVFGALLRALGALPVYRKQESRRPSRPRRARSRTDARSCSSRKDAATRSRSWAR